MWVIELILLIYFFYVVGYTTIFCLAGFFYRPLAAQNSEIKRFCVFIPCYKEDGVIIDVAKKALDQKYPTTHYTIVVVADSLQNETLHVLKSLPIRVLEVQFDSSTKVKALNLALNKIDGHFDYAIILDADNVMKEDFIAQMNDALSKGAMAIQGQRMPKNKNNSLAILDGISEAINNHIYRQGTVALGLSSAISGSGVAFDYKTLKRFISAMNSIGGFDRELELLFLRENHKVGYLKSAVVYDEKVSQSSAFQNQRRRWISSQYHYLNKYFQEGIISLFKGKVAFFNSSVLRNIQLPRLINLGLLTVLTLAFYFIRTNLQFGYTIWIFLFLLNSFVTLLAIPKEFYSIKLVKAVFQLPVIFVRMVGLLFKLKGANKKFIHTPHGFNHNSPMKKIE